MQINEQDFRSIVEEFKDLIFNISYKYTSNFDSAEDLSQEIFTRMWRYIDRFREESSLKTWIYRIAYTTAINYSKKHKNAFVSLDKTSFDIADKSTTETIIINRELETNIKKALSILPERQRIAIIFKIYDNRSYKEISEIMKISPKAVENLIYRARESMQKSLKEYI